MKDQLLALMLVQAAILVATLGMVVTIALRLH
jgi:hypothetical protein